VQIKEREMSIEKLAQPRAIFVIFNKRATHANLESLKKYLDRYFPKPYWTYNIYHINFDHDPLKIIQQALKKKNYVSVFAAGGDGTVSWAINGLARLDESIPLGVVPAGAGNAVAQEMNIPRTVKQSLKFFSVILNKEISTKRFIDIIKVGDKYCALHVDVGVGAMTVERAQQSAKKFFGVLAYIWAALVSFMRFRPMKYTISIDGKEKHVTAAEIVFANSRSLGLGPEYHWAPHIRPDDGVLDICIFNVSGMRGFVKMLYDVLRKRLYKNKNSKYFQAPRGFTSIILKTDSGKRVAVQGDGDVFAKTPIELQLLPRAVCLLCE